MNYEIDARLSPHLRTAMRKIVFGVLTSLVFSGCGQSLLYDATRDKMGQAAVKSAADLKLSDTITAVEDKFAGLLALEIEAVRARSARIREEEIREVAFKSEPIEKTWLARINKRISDLAGDRIDWNALAEARSKLQVTQKQVSERQISFQDDFLLSPPSCPDVVAANGIPDSIKKKLPPERQSEANIFGNSLLQKCQEFVSAQNQLDKLQINLGGILKAAREQKASDENEKKLNDHLREAATAQLKQEIEAYVKEVKSLDSAESNDTLRYRTAAAAQRLAQAIKGLESEQDIIGSEAVAEERLKQIETVLSALAGGETDPSKWNEDTRKAIAVAGSLPGLADDTAKALRDAKKPRLIPLLIAKEHQRLIVDEGAKIDKIMSARVSVSTRLIDLYESELENLLNFRDQLTRQKTWQPKSIFELNKDLPPDQKRVLYELLGTYFDEVPRLQSAQRVEEYTRLSTFYDESMVRSKSAALLWQSLLDGIANSIATYHSTGIKPEDLARLIQALGVTAVGIGANR